MNDSCHTVYISWCSLHVALHVNIWTSVTLAARLRRSGSEFIIMLIANKTGMISPSLRTSLSVDVAVEETDREEREAGGYLS